jgi:NADH:ubiquinone oxidoreductase subunit H
LWIVTSIILILLGLGGVAFVTLLERKLLGLSQIRLGPNKITLNGLLQPVIDGVKLLFKQLHVVRASQSILFTISPALLLILFIVVWRWLIPWNGSIFFLKYSSLVFFSLLGVGAYIVILTGWRRARRFSKLGRLRGILQRLSFEVALILVFIVALSFSYNITLEADMIVLWLVLWLILSLIETNRAPFDLLEGERELIRGFNIEIRSLTFVFLFLREYGIIIVLRIIIRLVLARSPALLGILYVVIILFLRRCYPRVRHDIIIRIIWEIILPLSVVIFFIFSVIK